MTHTVVMVWGQNVDNSTFTNNRIDDTFADGITLANDSQGNLLSNNAAHATGDDSFALFNAQDVHAGINQNNTYQNLTAILTWRAAGIAVYGGASNTFKNIYVADQLTYPGVTISSINFGISFIGFSGRTVVRQHHDQPGWWPFLGQPADLPRRFGSTPVTAPLPASG